MLFLTGLTLRHFFAYCYTLIFVFILCFYFEKFIQFDIQVGLFKTKQAEYVPGSTFINKKIARIWNLILKEVKFQH